LVEIGMVCSPPHSPLACSGGGVAAAAWRWRRGGGAAGPPHPALAGVAAAVAARPCPWASPVATTTTAVWPAVDGRGREAVGREGGERGEKGGR